MKKLILICVVILGSALTASAQTDNRPEFKFEKETHDFRKLFTRKSVSYDFKFTNIGEEPLIIASAEPSCTCMTAKFTIGPIKKGDAGVITVTYTPPGNIQFSQEVSIKSNTKTPVKLLYIKGEVVSASAW